MRHRAYAAVSLPNRPFDPGNSTLRVHLVRFASVIAVLLALPAASASAQQRDHNEVVRVPTEDPDMATAIRKAQATLDDFLAVWREQPPRTSGYKLKVRIRDGMDTEHFWVQPFKLVDGGYEGTLANEPRIVRNVRGGQRISFVRDDITDWGYVRDGKQVGSFTVCAMFKHAPKEQVDYYREKYGFVCEP